MTDQEMQALNEKLLRFAGFIRLDQQRRKSIDSPLENMWLFPDGIESIITPNFLDPIWGFAYQVRWIWPKLSGFHIEVHKHSIEEKYQVIIKTMLEGERDGVVQAASVEERIEVAAAKAVEQLIDREA